MRNGPSADAPVSDHSLTPHSLVDDITYSAATKSTTGLTASAILGPFWREDHPVRPLGTTISFDTPADGELVFMQGRVTDVTTGKPIAGAKVDVWQASTNGLYEQQDPKQEDLNLRGQFICDDEGRYSFYCLRPTPYPIPDDGPTGKLLHLMDRHFMRPAHIHFVVSTTNTVAGRTEPSLIDVQVRCDGFKHLTTQIFDKDCKYLGNDTVFAVKGDLSVEFKERKGDPQAKLEVEYDIALAPAASS